MVRIPQHWSPNPELMALAPEISGNTVNGLGEEEFRRPGYVYWAKDPDTIPHGRMQRWFYGHNVNPGFERARRERAAEMARPLPEVAPAAEADTPEGWAARIKAEAKRLGAEAVGVARMSPDWAFEGQDMPWRTVIMIGIAMDYETMDTAPEEPAGIEVVDQYNRGVRISKGIAAWLRERGHDCAPEYGPMAGSFTMIPAALAAGLGELGKHGSIINRELGSCFRLAAVLTDLDIAPDTPDDFGAEDFCTSCRICSDHCPPLAIMPEKQVVRGTRKWYVDFDKCLPFFNDTAGCAICVVVCPFSRPGVGENLVAKLARRRARTEDTA